MKKFESYLESPFRVLGVEQRSFTTKENEEIWSLKDGEDLYAVRKVPKNKVQLHDGMSYVKLFQDSWSHIKDLSPLSLKVMVYAITVMRPLSKVVYINPPDVMVACDLKAPSTVRNCVEDLLTNKIIAQKLGSNIEYWINPNVFFNGNRLRII